MCSLVMVFVSLALLGTGSRGHVLNDFGLRDDGSIESDQGYQKKIAVECYNKCAVKCKQAMGSSQLHCCSCSQLCERSCAEHLENFNMAGPQEPLSSAEPCARGRCELPATAWRSLLATCRLCRIKRRPRSPMLREAALIARSVGIDMGIDDNVVDQRAYSNEELAVIRTQMSVQLKSMVREEDTVSVQLSWSPLPGGSWYLVSWEPEGGGVRGNLLTNSSDALLTLWPDTSYHIQISSTTREDTSECLEVDTRSPPSIQWQFSPSGEEVEEVVAALVLFLIIALLISRRWRRGSESDKLVELVGDFDHFKLYPPPVTIQKPPSPSRPTLPI